MKKIILSPGIVIIAFLVVCNACKKDEGFTGLQPTITSVSPSEGAVFTELSIQGTNFESGATVFVGGIESSTVVVASSAQIYAGVPSGISANILLSVSVRNPGGFKATLENAFTAIPPVLDYVNSATKPSGNIGSTVILEGKAFGSKQGEGKVYFSDGSGATIEAFIANPDDWTDEFIVTTVPSGTEDGPVYIVTELGASNEIPFKVTEAATFSPSTINWTKTTSLPAGVSGHNALYVPVDDASGNTKQYVYVTGGKDNSATLSDQTLYGVIASDGNIAEWKNTTPLSNATAFHKAIAATPFNSKASGSGFLYVFGGIDSDGAPVNTVSVAELNNDGTIGTWSAATSLPVALHSLGAVIFRSTVYIAGGSTTGNTSTSKVYKSAIDENGNLGAWEELISMPSARSYHGLALFGYYLYAVGGEAGTAAPDDVTAQDALTDVIFAKIDLRSGDITDTGWTLNANALQKSRSKHTTLVVGGNMFVSSGLYAAAGQGSSENTYAQIFSDGTVDSFGGATGSNTLLTEGGSNLFNQAGLSYVDADGVAHVLILGGDDVNNPGTKLSNVLFY